MCRLDVQVRYVLLCWINLWLLELVAFSFGFCTIHRTAKAHQTESLYSTCSALAAILIMLLLRPYESHVAVMCGNRNQTSTMSACWTCSSVFGRKIQDCTTMSGYRLQAILHTPIGKVHVFSIILYRKLGSGGSRAGTRLADSMSKGII